MALVTIQRSPSTSSADSTASMSNDGNSVELHEEEKQDVVPNITSPVKTRKLQRQGSVSENFFAVKGAALILPRQTSLATDNLQLVKKFGGELQIHLRAIFHLLRPQDNIKLAVRLESWKEEHRRYLVIVSTQGRQDTDESIIIGCDFATRESTECKIGLVLPVWNDTTIRLNGDGGFKMARKDRVHIFKPVSVQAMWSALQTMHRCVDVARRHSYYEGSLYLTWTCYYQSKLNSERLHMNEWSYTDDLWDNQPNYLAEKDPERAPVELIIRNRLKQVMMTMDLDNCTCREIRQALEKVIDMDLTNYKQFIDNEMLTVLGQMDCPSEILEYLYLGSEWNASNFDELNELGITHILNVTMEVDNFFPGEFRYKNIRLHDVEESDLLPHWNNTWKFINEARASGGKCLVHCKMGISRSGATVCAYIMKERNWIKARALEFVRARRSIVLPNSGFMLQLDEYGGILAASAQRHNKLFRSRSESSLSEPSISDDHPISAAPVLSPRTSAPLIQVSDEAGDSSILDGSDFDLNRRLLDIASMETPKVSRPKSWSPDEGRRPYHAPPTFLNNQLTPDQYNGAGFPASEPEFIVPHGSDVNRLQLAEEKRKSFTGKRAQLRRHTAATSPHGGAHDLDDLAHSEDSVFVHVGTAKTPAARRKSPKARTSSPAALVSEPMTRPGALDVTTPEEPHPSMVSPMNSPSFKNAKNVDIDRIKSRFAIADSTDFAPPIEQSEQQGAPLKSQVPVRQIVAVIESPSDDTNLISAVPDVTGESEDSPVFVKGHRKTGSLPPANLTADGANMSSTPNNDDESSPASRSRSYSEALALSVRKIVTDIESRNSPNTFDPTSRPEGEGIQRTMSMPSSRRRTTSPLTPSASACSFVPVDEAVMESDASDEITAKNEPTTVSQFYIGDKKRPLGNANSNNNSNNLADCDLAAETLVISSPVKPEPIRLVLPSQTKDWSDVKRSGPMSPELLLCIREVGTQLLSDSVESSRSSSFSTSFSADDLMSASTQPSKKPGRVRQMAREIEKHLKKLTRRGSKSNKTKDKTLNEKSIPPAETDSSPNALINKLLMGGISPEKSKGDGDDCVSESSVRDLVGKFSSDQSQTASSPTRTPQQRDTTSPTRDVASPPRDVSSSTARAGIANLWTAAPYKPPKVLRGTSCSPPSVSRFKIKGARVRRTQSDRSTWRPTWLSSATCRRLSETASQPEAIESDTFAASKSKSSDDVNKPKSPGVGVRDIVRRIETIKSGVQRSSSLPASKERGRSESSSTPKPRHQHLTRSKSTPLLGLVKSAARSRFTLQT